MLADGYTVGDEGRRYTITLRQGVKFHTGKELTSADVIASLRRWGKLHTSGKAVWKHVEAIEEKDPYTLVIHLKAPLAGLLFGLGSPYAGIYPKDVVDAAGDGQAKQLLGTGPYRFVEHKPDRHVKLARFKDYAARSEPANGYGGKRTAYVDEILFIPTPDMSVRMAGLETGEFHYAWLLKQDQYERLKKNPALELSISKLGFWPVGVLNHKQGLLTSKKLRQALQAALHMEPIMAAAMGPAEFYRIDGSLFPRELVWSSTAATEAYNQRNKTAARRLLTEAGYAGQPVRWLTSQEYDFMYKTAVVAKQQLEDVGFKIDLQVVDWATLVQRRSKPELYEVFSTGFPSFPDMLDPSFTTMLQCDWPGWWCHEEKDRLLVQIGRESDVKKRKAIIDRVQAIFYEDVGRIKFGDAFYFHSARKELHGDFRTSPTVMFWNAWLTR
jgi:peptide/nickel transport system substrate-binding protein